jgi:sensor histidine kinase YesM
LVFGTIDVLDFRYWQSNEHLRDKASLTELAWYWNVLFGVLMAGANSMIKLYYRAISAEQRMAVLERENIESQMQYLKYQINPHFLMNTLNNIHSMIDFDKEMARKSVMDLSRMMRHVLYDSGEQTTTLDKEVEFISNYIELMRIRYIDDIDINFTFPDMNVCRKVELPPLLLIVLVENAFKHGISYNQESHINISLYVDGNEFTCIVANSRHYSHSSEHSGIGLSNITRRLDLLFNNRYMLDIDDSDSKQYVVKLVIPINP